MKYNKLVLLVFSLIFFSAVAEEEKFSDFDEKNRIEDNLNIDDINKTDNVLDIVTVFKLNNKIFINNSFDDIKNPTKDNTTNKNVESVNKSVEKYNNYSAELETGFKFHLYDDIKFVIPFKISYDFNYDADALVKLLTFDTIINRIAKGQVGFWIDWNALDYLKLGIRGGQDSFNGYAISLVNKVYSSPNDITPGFDILDWNILIFSELMFNPKSWMKIEPEARFIFRDGESTTLETDIVFAISLQSPVKIEYKILKELKIKSKTTPLVEKAFSGKGSKGSEAGYLVSMKQSIELEYKIMDVAKIFLPVTCEYKGRFANSTEQKVDDPTFIVKTVPGVEIEIEMFKGLSLVADGELDYKVYEITFGNTTTSKFMTSPTFSWGIGFKYNSK